MKRIYSNVWPVNYITGIAEWTGEYLTKLLNLTPVKTNKSFDSQSAIDLLLLDQTDEMQEFMMLRSMEVKVGLTYRHSPNYAGWNLVVATDSDGVSIDILVSKFFAWTNAENDNLLSFNELLELN